jgi:hypothetical protein
MGRSSPSVSLWSFSGVKDASRKGVNSTAYTLVLALAALMLVGCKSKSPLLKNECVGSYESFAGSKDTGTGCFALHGDGSYTLGDPQPNDALGYFHLPPEGNWQLGQDTSGQRLFIHKTTLPIERNRHSIVVTVNDDLGMSCVLTPGKAVGVPNPQYPPRPTTPPPAFKLFHHDATSITLVTAENASDQQIEALIYQLHDTARAHTFDQLHIPQKLVDARDPILWFHIYRGPKCADEKYTSGPLPCGASYHAAGDYTLGSFANKDHDDAVLLEPDGHQLQLWNPNAPPAPSSGR